MSKKGDKRLDNDGVPINQDDWTLQDWQDLWAGIHRIKTRIAKRHGDPLKNLNEK